MKYQVRKDGRIYAQTAYPECRYSPEIEATLQGAGYEIYVDGKRQKKVKVGGTKDGNIR